MLTHRLELKRRYTRSDPKGLFPRVTGLPELEHNRLGAFWRPIIDMGDSELAPMRLRMIRPVSSWLADPTPGRWSWFAMIGVAGLRHQVLRHAGLDRYDCREPAGLAAELRTPQWCTLVDAIDRFGELDDCTRALVVFQLAQLSYCQHVFTLAGVVPPNGDPVHDRYAYEVARVHARYPGHASRALPVFEHLASSSPDPVLALLSCFQGISHAIRSGSGLELAHRFEDRGRELAAHPGYPQAWHGRLVRSRFHRALALLRIVERQGDAMRRELDAALHLSEQLLADAIGDIDALVALENRRILVESQIKAASRDRDHAAAVDVRALCAELIGIDPHCVEARLVAGDGHVAIGDYETAASWYTRAGELATGAGAMGWFRAAQCYDFIGDRGRALNAMGRCLELDATAVEPQEYLTGAVAGAR